MFGADTFGAQRFDDQGFGGAREAYLGGSIATASPARLLVMLVERLELDVRRGLEAQQTGDAQTAHDQLVHAQEIVIELISSLKPELFTGGPELLALYDYLHRLLVTANVRKDPAVTEECLTLAGQIADTWRQAALQSAATA